jgi:hypothetical protein
MSTTPLEPGDNGDDKSWQDVGTADCAGDQFVYGELIASPALQADGFRCAKRG